MSDPMAPEAPTTPEYPYFIDYDGRQLRLKLPDPLQLSMILRRLKRRAGDEGPANIEQDMDLIGQMFDALAGWFHPDDGDFLEEEVMAGRLGLRELEGLVNQFNQFRQPEPAPKTGPVRARRRR